MATTKPRFPITLEPEIAKIVEDYKRKHNIKTTSGATVELLMRGIDEFYKPRSEDEISEVEQTHIKKYRAIDERGRINVDNLLETEYQYILKQRERNQQKEEYIPQTMAAHNDSDWTEAHDRDLEATKELARQKRDREKKKKPTE